ncbi:MAG: 16S rRNA (guanine(966)-N(2))-methyltransferase RsmD [Candidatus Schekmanbacteria bacterium]|nr:MAG: 16S rRNA (guanine(966)-N(2))-methyltransferase RsmD [Candidatus Schekmanbacteria bacterium]
MRITGGKKARHRLSSFPKDIIRPTQDKVREAVFNTLGNGVEGTDFLDLFAGTGSVGIEALSRGAERVVFIEKNRNAVSVIKKNLQIAGLDGFARIIQKDFREALKMLVAENISFHIIYCDPPYASDYSIKCLSEVNSGQLLLPNGTMILEIFKKRSFPEKEGKLHLMRERLYGETRILYYKNISD